VTAPAGTPLDLRAARRRLLLDTAGIAVSAIGFGFVFGLAARNAGYSPIEASAMSVITFAGAAQFAAVGYVAAGLPWAPIVILTLLLNARHLLYSASLAPRLRGVPFLHRAAMAHMLTDEAFALAATHFHRLGRVDVPGYWIGAVLGVFIPWNLATMAGVLLGGAIPEPSVFGLDVVFPAAMAGLAVGLVTGRREVVAAGSGAVFGVLLSLLIGPAMGIVAGGLLGPLAGMAMPEGGHRGIPDSDVTGLPVDLDKAIAEVGELGEPGELPAEGGEIPTEASR
jgi:4-azaleucine resistance transporter AzlC